MPHDDSHYKVVYLTGAPATGKSTLLSALEKTDVPLHVFSYAAELAKHLNKRVSKEITHEELRTSPSAVISPEDIRAVDDDLLRQVASFRGSTHVLIDTHAVSREDYGFRVTPFRAEQIRALNPSFIVCLYSDPRTICVRIQNDAHGRPQISEFTAEVHSELQNVVAVTYGIVTGAPVYFLDSSAPVDALVAWLTRKLQKT